MRTHAVILAVISLVAAVGLSRAADDAKEDAVKKELRALKGMWKPIAREVDGKKISDEELKDVTVTYEETGKLTVRRGDMILLAGIDKLDPTKNPKMTDLTYTEGENKGKTSLGIYEIEGDTLRTCRALPGNKRPTEFSAKAGSGHALTLSKREKPKPGHQTRPIVFTHATVIDATGGPAVADTTVVIIGERIAALGPNETVRIPSDAHVVDVRGKFMIPGLWDMHVHWYLNDYLPLFIANGVTGVRQMNGRPDLLDWRKEMTAGKLLGPRMVIASPIVDGPRPIWPNSIKLTTASEAREAVTVIKRQGYDFLKVYHPIPREAYFALAHEAKIQGLSFVGHLPLSVTASEASDVGQKSIEHLSGVLVACSKQEVTLKKDIIDALAAKDPNPSLSLRAKLHSDLKALETYDDTLAAKLFERFVRNGTWHVPTLTILRGTAHPDSVANDPRLKYLPPAVRARSTQATSPFTSGFTKAEVEDGKKVYRKYVELAGAMQRAGVRFLAGTDTSENGYCFPGFSLHDELALLVESGLKPMEALQAATLNPARFLGNEKDLGTIAKGKLADLVLLEANPLQDIKNTQKIYAVVVGGKLIPKSELALMLAKVEATAKADRGGK
jgi:uncharacterized protein (TIGR03067 family)